MLKARGFSLSTKFILFAVVLELILIVGGLFTAYSYLGDQRIQLTQHMLQAQVDLLAKQVELDKYNASDFRFQELDLNPAYSFQILDEGGRVFYDSHLPGRLNKQLLGPHTLLDLAKHSTQARGVQEFLAPQTTEFYFGAFHKTGAPHYYVLGAASLSSVQLEIFRILEKFLVLGTLFCGLSFLIITLFSIRMIRPIRKLTAAARELSNGNFDFDIRPDSADEIGTLSEAFSIMAQRVQDLLGGEIQKLRIEKEVLSVADIQRSLLPAATIDRPRFEIEGFYLSATETGGDYWGFFETPRYLVTYVADATGHGLPSAMLTAAARGCFSAIHRFALDTTYDLLPSQILRLANEAVFDSAQEELNMTMFVTVYDFEKHTLTYSNAAHCPAWILRGDEAEPRLELLKGLGPRLGENLDFESGKDHTTTLSEKDVLFLYTDGLTDCTNPEDIQLGKPQVKTALLQSASESMEPKHLKGTLIRTFEEFTNGQPIIDDITFAFMKRKP